MMSKVVIGLSGGVDSAVSAYLLKQAGYEVIGVHLLLLPAYCGQTAAPEDARAVAEQLGIEFHLLDRRAAFAEKVVEPFCAEYFHGRTPSPCLVCNREIKFGLMADFAAEIGAEYIATGHYAKVAKDEQGASYLAKAADLKKDQSYFLCRIRPEVIEKIIFPLSGKTKDEIREIAKNIGLKVASKPDSQEVCFITDNDYKNFLHTHYGRGKAGFLRDNAGKIIAPHNGVENFTIGQRKGLGVALGKVVYVTAIDGTSGDVLLGEHEELMSTELLACDNIFHTSLAIGETIEVEAKVRYRANAAKATLLRLNERETKVTFSEPQRAVTPGQTVCYYRGNRVIGGGVIEKVLKKAEDPCEINI